MPKWLTAVGSGLFCAVITTFMFWWFNNFNFFQVNGIGWLRRQASPINSPWFWSSLAFVIGTGVGLIRNAVQARHIRRTRELAEELGQDFEETYSLPPGAEILPVFSGWESGCCAMTSREEELPVTVFDCTTNSPAATLDFKIGDGAGLEGNTGSTPVPRSDKSNQLTDRTVVLQPIQGLPGFYLVPRTSTHSFLPKTGLDGLTFDSQTARSTDVETIEQFTRSFRLFHEGFFTLLKEPAENRPTNLSDEEETVRRMFSPAVMEIVNQYPAYSIQSRAGFLAIWRGSGVIPAQKRIELCSDAIKLSGILTHAHESGTGPVIPSRPGSEPGRQAQNVIRGTIGNAIGMFIGFLLSAILMPLVLFNNFGFQRPGLGFLIMPIVFIGCIFAGRSLGSRIGLLFQVGNSVPGPPEDQTEQFRRLGATGCASLIGLFGGFFSGAILFSTFVLNQGNPNQNDFGLRGALFFGSIFGGAFLGALICGTVVNRLYHWRQSRHRSDS